MAAVDPRDLLVYAGGEVFAKYGRMVKSVLPGAEVAEVHTRGSGAYAADPNGKLIEVASNVPRIEWVDLDGDGVRETPLVLTEGAGTNQFTQPTDLSHGDWTKTRCSVNANQTTGPDGTTSLDEVVEDSTAAANHHVNQGATLTADANYAMSAFCIANTRTFVRLQVGESGSFGTNYARAWFNLSTGAASTTGAGGTGAFVRAYVEDWTDVADGLYRCVLVGSVGNSATAIVGAIMLADADASESYNGDGSSSIYAGHAMLEDDQDFASSWHDATRGADVLYLPFPFPPQTEGMTVYGRIPKWLAGQVSSRIFHVGAASQTTDPRFQLAITAGGNLQAIFDDGTTETAHTAVSAPALDDDFEFVVEAKPGDNLKLRPFIGGTEQTNGESASAIPSTTFPTAFADQRLYIGSGGSTLNANIGLHRLKVVRGVNYTLDELRAAV